MIYTFLIYNRKWECIFFQEWNKKPSPKPLEDQQLLNGLLRTLRQFVATACPVRYDFPFIYLFIYFSLF
jgi:hypothetical protein